MLPGEIVDFADLDLKIQELIRESVTAFNYSYSPYSGFKVGSAVLCEDGSISTGCNIENASYPVAICAERVAIGKAVSEGKRTFKAIAVVADHESAPFTAPCGLCRQTIVEFGDVDIYLARTNMKSVLQTTINSLLPLSFQLKKD